MHKYEHSLFQSDFCNTFAFLSKSELEQVNNWVPRTEDCSWHSPVGVDIDRFEKAKIPTEYDRNSQIIVFTGTMRYPPNVEAVTWFTKDVFPLIKSNYENTEFFIVGKDPTDQVKNLNNVEGVNVTGKVESIEPYITHADVSVLPLKQATGIQIKLLEALAAGNPVVSTPTCVTGTEFTDEKHLIVSDSAEDFAKSVCSIFRNPELSENMSMRGKNLINKKYAWPVIIDRLENKLFEISEQSTHD